MQVLRIRNRRRKQLEQPPQQLLRRQVGQRPPLSPPPLPPQVPPSSYGTDSGAAAGTLVQAILPAEVVELLDGCHLKFSCLSRVVAFVDAPGTNTSASDVSNASAAIRFDADIASLRLRLYGARVVPELTA